MSEIREFAKSLINKTFKSRMENFQGTGEILYIKVNKANSPESDVDCMHLQITHYIVKVPLKSSNLYETVSIDKKNASEDIYSDIILYSEDDFLRTFTPCGEDEWQRVKDTHAQIKELLRSNLQPFIDFEQEAKKSSIDIMMENQV